MLEDSDPSRIVILVVDDEQLLRNVIRLELARVGYCVLTAEDGDEALSISREYVGPIHVLLSDIVMPKMSGLVLAQRILEERPDTKVLLMSAYPEATLLERSVLLKPFNMKVFKERIRQLVKETVKK